MTISTLLILALIAGIIAKLVMPERGLLSWSSTPVVGAAGVIVATQLASTLSIGGLNGVNPLSIVLAISGAMIVHLGYRLAFDV